MRDPNLSNLVYFLKILLLSLSVTKNLEFKLSLKIRAWLSSQSLYMEESKKSSMSSKYPTVIFLTKLPPSANFRHKTLKINLSAEALT